MKMGGKLKTTGNAKRPVSGKPASVKVPGLPGLGGAFEAKGSKGKMSGKIKGMKASANSGGRGAC